MAVLDVKGFGHSLSSLHTYFEIQETPRGGSVETLTCQDRSVLVQCTADSGYVGRRDRRFSCRLIIELVL